MKNARLRSARRAGALRAAWPVLAVAMVIAGCGGGGDDEPAAEQPAGTGGTAGSGGGTSGSGGSAAGKGGASGGSAGTGGSAGAGGTGGAGASGSAGAAGSGGKLGSGDVSDLTPASSGNAAPFDAVPSPDGATLYFTALEPEEGTGAVFSVMAAGGALSLVAKGFDSPIGISVSVDGKTLYVADHEAEDPAATPDSPGAIGAIFTVMSSGGTPVEVAGTRGYRPRALDVVKDGAGEVVYFVGNDLGTKMPGVFKLSGTAVSTVLAGGSLAEPSGVAASSTGDVFVAEVSGTGARIVKVSKGAESELVGDLKLGYPAGVALSQDEKFLLASGHGPEGGSLVYRIDLATGAVTTVDKGISQNTESAGLHRAHAVDTYAWCDAAGTIYLVKTKP